MSKYYFTFGSNHMDIDGNSLGQKYVVVEASDPMTARETFVAVRGIKFSSQYREEQFLPQIDAYGLTEIKLEYVRWNDEIEKMAEMEHTLKEMDTYGGSFVKQLAVLYRMGDPINKKKLENTFKEYFEQYKNY